MTEKLIWGFFLHKIPNLFDTLSSQGPLWVPLFFCSQKKRTGFVLWNPVRFRFKYLIVGRNPVSYLLFAFTSTIFLPQVQLPGFWLMVSHLHSGPQSQTYFATLANGFFLDSTVIFPFSTFVTFVFTRSLSHVHLPGFLDIVSHGQPSPQAHT